MLEIGGKQRLLPVTARTPSVNIKSCKSALSLSHHQYMVTLHFDCPFYIYWANSSRLWAQHKVCLLIFDHFFLCLAQVLFAIWLPQLRIVVYQYDV